MVNQETKQKKSNGKSCCAAGCGCVLPIVLIFAIWLTHIIWYHRFGENEPTAPMFHAEKGKNFSYDFTYLNRFCEFEISENDFLDWCKNRKYPWNPVEIETLPSLPKPDWNEYPQINDRREVPLSIIRYCYKKPEHENCRASFDECQIDPTGKTDESCFHTLDNGYYYESRSRDGGGVYVLFDREKNRCYIYWAHH